MVSTVPVYAGSITHSWTTVTPTNTLTLTNSASQIQFNAVKLENVTLLDTTAVPFVPVQQGPIFVSIRELQAYSNDLLAGVRVGVIGGASSGQACVGDNMRPLKMVSRYLERMHYNQITFELLNGLNVPLPSLPASILASVTISLWQVNNIQSTL